MAVNSRTRAMLSKLPEDDRLGPKTLPKSSVEATQLSGEQRVSINVTSVAMEQSFPGMVIRRPTHPRHEGPEHSVSLDEPNAETGTTLDLAASAPNAEENLLRRERLAAIRNHVEALPERQRLAVIMHKYQSMDYGQIAEVLELSESAT